MHPLSPKDPLMTHREVIRSAESARATASARMRRLPALQATVSVIASGIMVVLVALFAEAVASGPWRFLTMAIAMVLTIAPVAYFGWRDNVRKRESAEALTAELERQLTDALESAEREADRRTMQVQRQEFEGRLANALEMAEDEHEVIGVVERA